MVPIGFVESPFQDRYGVPRQPALALAAKGKIKLKKDPDLATALKTLEQFSHLWVVFIFHEHGGKNWKPSIRPPRLGGREKVGVLASRSPHRPNPIGISPVKIEGLNLDAEGGVEILVSGLDLLDGTPVLDLKPYIPYADSIPEATSGWADESVPKYPVHILPEALEKLGEIEKTQTGFRELMIQILELDPRPAYQKRDWPVENPESWGREYGIEIQGLEVKYRLAQNGISVWKIE